ncbi:MAG: rRNA (adenine2503-C2)-methyltransferase [Pseudomonadota bacterium]|jgi:23S rRNA (adenine2503-C2)-methyltransferase
MQIDLLRQRLRALGAKDCHEDRILRAWLQAKPLDQGSRRLAEHYFPLELRAALPAISAELEGTARVLSEHPGSDGSIRLLVALADGQTVESVLLPRDGLCVSTQVGCAVGCQFCMTGQSGLLRQLSAGEILAQFVLARQRRPVKKVVFMGMGEPSHNLDNVLDAIELMATHGGIGHKNLVFSTVGDRRVFERLPQGRVKPALAVSLHTTDPELRARLLPRAQRINPDELVELAETYARASGYPVQYQWTLLEGINDGDAELERLTRLLAGKYAMMNFIPFNSVEGSGFGRPSEERCWEMAQQLRRHGIIACLRDSAGQDVDGGCGQLRARALGNSVEPRDRLSLQAQPITFS